MSTSTSRAWLPVGAAMLACGWGGNQFTPLLLLYRDAGYSVLTVDLLLGAYVVGLVPALLLTGGWSDRIGRKPVMLAGTVCSLVASLFLAHGPDGGLGPVALSIGRFVTGVAVAVAMSVGSTWVKELSDRAGASPDAGTGRAALCLTLGLGIGPGVAGALAQWGPWPTALPYLVHAVLVAAVLPALTRAPETAGRRRLGHLPVTPRRLGHLPVTPRRLGHLPVTPRRLGHLPVTPRRLVHLPATGRRQGHLPVTGRRLGRLPATADASLARDEGRFAPVRHPRFRRVIVPMAPWIFGSAGVAYAIMPQLVDDRVGRWGLAYSTLLTVCTLGAGTAVQPLARRIDRVTSARGVLVGMVVMSSGLAASAIAAALHSPVAALFAAVILGAAYGIAILSGLLELGRLAPPEQLAGLIGVYYALAYVGFLLPSLLAVLSVVVSYPLLLVGLASLALAGTLLILRHSRNHLPHAATVPEPQPA